MSALILPSELPLTRRQLELVDANAEIMGSDSANADYLHGTFANCSLPRKRFDGKEYVRILGNNSLRIEAGKVWTGTEWQEQPIPYGPKPRLLMIYMCSFAVRTKTRIIPFGSSLTDLMRRLGFKAISGGDGGSRSAMKKQLTALAVSRMTLGVGGRDGEGRLHTMTSDANLVDAFQAWVGPNDKQIWPECVELSESYYHSIKEHAFPLNQLAISALNGSALDLDLYAFLAYRLHRVSRTQPLCLSWGKIFDQFGFNGDVHSWSARRAFMQSVTRVRMVYPEAKLEAVKGGVRFMNSPPPVAPRPMLVKG